MNARRFFTGRAIALIVLLLLLLLWAEIARATEPTSDCVIDQQLSSWNLQEDGSALVTEDLSVNCGNLSNKHGIFRIIPQRVANGTRPSNYRLETPISDLKVVDERGNPYTYITSTEGDNLSIKIGDADRLISGRLRYVISYKIANLVWPNPDTGEQFLSLNVVGQFWTLPIDRAEITIDFPFDLPAGIEPKIVRGPFGSDAASASTRFETIDANSIRLIDEEPFSEREGVTISYDLPADSFSLSDFAYSPWERYVGLIWLLWPVWLWRRAWAVWTKSGRDAKLKKAHMVQYSPPAGLDPYEAFQLQNNGGADSKALAGLIVGLAVKGYLQIEKPTGGIFKSKQIEFICTKLPDGDLSAVEKTIMTGLFGDAAVGERVSAASFRSSYGKGAAFRQAVSDARRKGKERLIKQKLFEDRSVELAKLFIPAVIGLAAAFMLVPFMGLLSFIGPLVGVAGIVGLVVFLIFMPRRTPAGAEVEWQLRGFQDYLKTAEQYRLEFSEKENLFEKYLPYAVTFGVVAQWARAMRNLYGEEYWSSYHPVWYVGSFDISDIDSFSANLNSLASDISSSMSAGTSTGSSGGGGGGGGGGSW